MLHFLLVLSKDEVLSNKLVHENKLHDMLYKAVKFSDPVFSKKN